MLKIARLTLNPFGVNTYILSAESGDAIIVDAGCSNNHEREQLIKYVERNQLRPVMTINTHAHIDHIVGVDAVKEAFGIEWGLAEAGSIMLGGAMVSAQMYGFEMHEAPRVDFTLSDGQEIALGEDIIRVISTPGHSAGGVCFYVPSCEVLISGDTLFRGSIGRTDLPTGDYNALMESIVTKILPLGDDIQVLPGHGDSTTIGTERNTNPFVTEYLSGTTDTIQERI